ncbi:hypothetical protein ABZY44_33920 [Streptomyces sp. NPDC006544]|uniref:hypothetical protein n=1 Tax=Streptomyces sp. NPDC006544 TaxID=3154583 RepID=UPI0033A19996
MGMREKIWNEATPAERRLAGLAVNPAAPDRPLLRILADGPPAALMALCGDRDLPEPVVDAVVSHPDRRGRAPSSPPVRTPIPRSGPGWWTTPSGWCGAASPRGPPPTRCHGPGRCPTRPSSTC